jgi:hypothetical protein
MGTGSFPGVKRPGRGAGTNPRLTPRSRECTAIPLPSSGPSDLLGVSLPLPFCSLKRELKVRINVIYILVLYAHNFKV